MAGEKWRRLVVSPSFIVRFVPTFKMKYEGMFVALVLFLIFVLDRVSASEAPQIAPMKDPEDLEEGQRLAIMCAVRKGSLPLSFSWRRNNIPVAMSDDVKILHNDDYQEALQIEKLNANHVGNFSCSVKNLYGTDKATVQIKLKFGPRWTDPQPIVEGEAGGIVSLNCLAQAYPPPVIRIRKGKILKKTNSSQMSDAFGNTLYSWYEVRLTHFAVAGEELVVSSPRITIKDGLMTLSNVRGSDKGDYICEASNPLGRIIKTVTLALTGMSDER